MRTHCPLALFHLSAFVVCVLLLLWGPQLTDDDPHPLRPHSQSLAPTTVLTGGKDRSLGLPMPSPWV